MIPGIEPVRSDVSSGQSRLGLSVAPPFGLECLNRPIQATSAHARDQGQWNRVGDVGAYNDRHRQAGIEQKQHCYADRAGTHRGDGHQHTQRSARDCGLTAGTTSAERR